MEICPRSQCIVVFIHQLVAPHFQATNSRCVRVIEQVFGNRLALKEATHTAHSHHLFQGTYHSWRNLALEVVDCCRLELSNGKGSSNRSRRIPCLKLKLAVSEKKIWQVKSPVDVVACHQWPHTWNYEVQTCNILSKPSLQSYLDEQLATWHRFSVTSTRAF